MRKIARRLSTRTKGHSSSLSTTPSNDDLSATAPNKKPFSATGPVSYPTTIHFPKCVHTTPPTPRPAYIPSAVRTEIVESPTSPTVRLTGSQDPEVTGALEDIIPAGLEERRPDPNDNGSRGPLQIYQYLSSPPRCLDCTLFSAREREGYLRDQSAATLREYKLRLVEIDSGVRAICRIAETKRSPIPGSTVGKLAQEDKDAIAELDAEEAVIKEKMENEKRKPKEDIRALWEVVRKDWDGGIRGVVRSDGTGEAEERCHFVFSWETARNGGKGAGNVQIKWIPMDG